MLLQGYGEQAVAESFRFLESATTGIDERSPLEI